MSLTTWLMGTPEQELAVVDAVPRELWRSMEEGRVPPLHSAMPQLAYEVARARRYERPLTITLFGAEGVSAEPKINGHVHLPPLPPADDSPMVVQAWVSSAVTTMLLATLLRESVREADIVTYTARYSICIVALPETTAEGAQHAVDRLQHLCQEKLLTRIRAGIAEFSKAGWTLEELIRQAEANATTR